MRRLKMMALLVAASSLFVVSEARAERPRVLGRAMVQQRGSFHGNYGGAENTYWDTGSRLGARLRAANAWRGSPGHAANMRNHNVGGILGIGLLRTRVVGVNGGIAVVGR
jgi:hypothetical protein